MFRTLPRFRPGGPAAFSTWLHTVTHNHLIDRHRRGRARGAVIPLEDMPVGAGLDAHLDRKRRAERLHQALARLPEAQRRAVVLHYLKGLTTRRIATEEGVPAGTIKSRLHHGRARLLDILKRGGS